MEVREVKSDTYQHEIIKRYLTENSVNDCKVLDIGCEVPVSLFDLDIEFPIAKFYGIDILPDEYQLIRRYWYLEGIEGEVAFNTIKECYINYLNSNGVNAGLSKSIIESKIENYDKRYSIQTGINCLDLTSLNLGEFDILFGIGLLHFLKLKQAIEFVKSIPSFLKNHGIVVLTANHEQNFSMNDLRYSEKLGKRNFRQKDLNEVVYLFDDFGILKIIESLEKCGVERMVFEKYKNTKTHTFEDYLYIGKKNTT